MGAFSGWLMTCTKGIRPFKLLPAHTTTRGASPNPLAPPKFSKIKFQKITPNFPAQKITPKNHAKLSRPKNHAKKSRQSFRLKNHAKLSRQTFPPKKSRKTQHSHSSQK